MPHPAGGLASKENNMREVKKWVAVVGLAAACAALAAAPGSEFGPRKAAEIARANGLSPEQAAKLERALARAPYATQGLPGATRHPMSSEQCQAEVLGRGLLKGGESDVAECGYPNMAVVPGANGKKVCIDRYEFPNIPCDYPATWVQANEAAAICESEGKRLCDAHEWEGACANEPQPEDWRHPGNGGRRSWAYGPERKPELCGVGGSKSPGCDAAIASNKNVRGSCGPNTWPSGANYQCAGPLGVYDMHGNAAEHMNLARNERESGANGGHGVTEMKGSWFVFSKNPAARPVHEDYCQWRAPGWHRTGVLSPASHANYHLGFRCCANAK